MLPTLLQISFAPALPRFLLVLALFITLLVAAFGLLIGAKKWLVLGLSAAAAVLVALLTGRAEQHRLLTIHVSAFGAGLCLSVALGCAWVLWRAKHEGVSGDATAVRVCCALLAGLLGARFGYWLLFDAGPTSWRDIFNFQRGGLFGFGAYLGGLLATLLVLRNDQRAFARWLDQLSLPLLLGVGLVRIGCYFDGCDFGRPLRPGAHAVLVALGTFPRWESSADDRFLGSPAWVSHVSHWGLSPDAPVSLPVHPVQLYEAVLAFGLLLLALAFRQRLRPAGILFLSLAAAYGLGYFLLGFLRGDLTPTVLLVSKRLRWSIPFGSHEQLVALAVCVLSVLPWRSWMHEQPFLAKFSPLFRAAKAKISSSLLVGRFR